MDIKAEFLRIMAEQTEIALATSVNNVPNVRIVKFFILSRLKIYFTFRLSKENDKVKEIKRKSKRGHLPPFLTKEMSMSKLRG